MCVPLVICPDAARGQADRQFRQRRRQRAAPTQIFAEPRQMPTNFGRADQELEWPPEPAALAGDDLVMNLFLRRGHLGGADLAVTAHLNLPSLSLVHMIGNFARLLAAIRR